MNIADAKRFAKVLDDARLETREIEKLSAGIEGGLKLDDAYRIQEEGQALRQERGERLVGYKMGLTSEAKRQQMGLHQPIYGFLTDRMEVGRGEFRMEGSIHPKIEPEIAFGVYREIRGVPTREQALAACEWVAPALEILDSRYRDFKYFSLEDVVADNSSSSHFAIGPHRAPRDLDLKALEMSLFHDGELAQSAVSSAISGDPVLSLVQLCELLSARGRTLPAGSVVLAGAATQAVQLKSGSRVRLEVRGLGAMDVNAR